MGRLLCGFVLLTFRSWQKCAWIWAHKGNRNLLKFPNSFRDLSIYALMVKPVAAAIISVALASTDVVSDDALSLLQTRVTKNQVQQAPTLADGSVLEVRAGGTLCEEDEVITFAKCVEAQKRQVVPNTMAAHGDVYHARGHGYQPTGCFKLGGNMYFNDEPGTDRNGHNSIMPICQAGGGGGRAAEIIAQGFSCQEPTCQEPVKKQHFLKWDDSVFVPELKLGAKGGVCEEACEILTYEQCDKAGDMGLIDELTTGFTVKHELNHQTFGAVHTSGSNPSGCSVHTGHGNAGVYFNSMDTPTGAHAAPNTAGDPWITPSGVGSGYGYVAPVCGVCTTTTTTEPDDDQGSAVGDPHMSYSGKSFDMDEGMVHH